MVTEGARGQAVFFFFCLLFSVIVVAAQEEKLQYFGTVYNTSINDDRVNVRAYPSLKR